MDRHIQPPLSTIENPVFLKPDKRHTKQGHPYFSFVSHHLPVIKLDIMFPVGSINDNNPAVPLLTANLLTAGTSSLTAQQIAETIDFHGTSIYVSVSKRYTIFQINLLPKFAKDIFSLLTHLFVEPVFPQHEVNLIVNKHIRHLQINMEKVNFLASRLFNKIIFSENHPFGRSIQTEDYKNISRKQLLDFYIRLYKKQKPIVVISGDINDTISLSLENFIDNIGGTTSLFDHISTIDIPSIPVSKQCFPKTGVQSAIRYGKLTINKYHPDYFNLFFTVTLLGGYFGSRLIQNIREDKGYTYGIYAYLNSFTETGFFYVSADVGSNYGQATIEEVEKEIKNLQKIPVTKEEIERVRNYMTGIFLQKIDGIFAISDAFLDLKKFNLDWDYFNNFLKTINGITPEIIMNMANKYLNTNKMSSLIVGQC